MNTQLKDAAFDALHVAASPANDASEMFLDFMAALYCSALMVGVVWCCLYLDFPY